jgi:hypothetical protein
VVAAFAPSEPAAVSGIRRQRPLVAARRARPTLDGRIVRTPRDVAVAPAPDADPEQSFAAGLFIQADRAGTAES